MNNEMQLIVTSILRAIQVIAWGFVWLSAVALVVGFILGVVAVL